MLDGVLLSPSGVVVTTGLIFFREFPGDASTEAPRVGENVPFTFRSRSTRRGGALPRRGFGDCPVVVVGVVASLFMMVNGALFSESSGGWAPSTICLFIVGCKKRWADCGLLVLASVGLNVNVIHSKTLLLIAHRYVHFVGKETDSNCALSFLI